MKTRLLKELLGDTLFAVHKSDNRVCIGSPMCSDLISVDMSTMKIRYAIDTFNEGRKCLNNKETLGVIWDKLQGLIDSGELQDIWDKDDEITHSIAVYRAKDGVIELHRTDEYGWPNVTASGEIMYNNEFFKTEKEALVYGIDNAKCSIENLEQRIEYQEEELSKTRKWLKESNTKAFAYRELLKEQK
jgi:hypothetical protein